MDVIFLKSLRPLYCDYISRILCVRRAQQGRPPRPPFMYFYSRPYTRGDANRMHYSEITTGISTRAPTRGATKQISRESASIFYFYSRPYTRGDASKWAKRAHSRGISTRAPTRGATLRRGSSLHGPAQFLLAPLHEGRQQFFTKP